jgi:hypothetical protein
MIPFSGFFPDADDHSEGVITDCTMMLPSLRGYKGAPSVILETPALAAACRGATYVVKLDGTTRLFAGTQTKLYEYASSVWGDVSAVGDYTGSADSVWRFAQFGDVTIAVNLTDATQKSVSTGDFSALSGAPKALVIDTVGGFVMVGNYNTGSAVLDGVYWSAYLDYTDWTADIATQCGNLRLLDTPGAITALKRLGQYAVAYKENSLYLGVNNGPPTLWGFNLISGEIGTFSQESIVSVETAHFFIGPSDIYLFDGSRPQPIGDGIREWFYADLSIELAYKIRGVHDKQNSLIYWYYPSIASTGNLDSCIVFNYKSRKWGRANRSVEVCLEYLTGATTYAGLETDYPTYDAFPDVSYGSPFWTATTPNMAVFDTTHTLGTLTGPSLTSSLTSGAIGDDMQLTMISRVQPRFVNDPTSGTMTNYYRMTDGASYTTDATIAMNSGRFDVMRDARWHKFKTDYVGDVEVVGQSYHLVPGGYE